MYRRRKTRYDKGYVGYGVRAPQVVDSGDDAPLSNRAAILWRVVIALLIIAFVILVAVSR